MNLAATRLVQRVNRGVVMASVMALSLVILALSSSPVHAGTRVLIRFDETGHYIHRIHRSPANDSRVATSNHNATDAEVELRWLDGNGHVLATTRTVDPRVTHAPIQQGSTDISWTIHYEGAYLVAGPDTAAHLEIILPKRDTPSVPNETWLLDLL